MDSRHLHIYILLTILRCLASQWGLIQMALLSPIRIGWRVGLCLKTNWVYA